MLFRIVSVCFIALLVLRSSPVLATPPCPPDYSSLCKKIGGTWTPSSGECAELGAGTCSKPMPLVDFQCKKDSDCRPCGIDRCLPRPESFSPTEFEALGREESIGTEYYFSCSPAANQTCGCRNGRCEIIEPAVDCRSASDCFYCCGSCQPVAAKGVFDCDSMCILKDKTARGCSCVDNHCRLGN